MSFLFVFPYDLEDITKEVSSITEDSDFVNNLRVRIQEEKDNFAFDKRTFDQLTQVILEQEQKQSISVSLLKAVIQISELSKKSFQLLKELGREWKNNRRQYYI